jgi:hypothetical protein
MPAAEPGRAAADTPAVAAAPADSPGRDTAVEAQAAPERTLTPTADIVTADATTVPPGAPSGPPAPCSTAAEAWLNKCGARPGTFAGRARRKRRTEAMLTQARGDQPAWPRRASAWSPNRPQGADCRVRSNSNSLTWSLAAARHRRNQSVAVSIKSEGSREASSRSNGDWAGWFVARCVDREPNYADVAKLRRSQPASRW